jgi:hypothetical protein
MDEIRHPRVALAVILAAATLAAGCGAPHQRAGVVAASAASAGAPGSTSPTPTSSAPGSQGLTTPSVVPGGGRGRSGRLATGSRAAAGELPADWPPDLPVPQGDIMGSTGAAGRWTVLIIAAGSAAQVRRSTVAFYSAAGFTAVSDSVLDKGTRQITLVVENRDHSATQTNLVIGVTTR